MDQLRNFGDERQQAWCVHCGRTPTTRDHIPSKILLDDPVPSNLYVVGTCKRCNHGLSLDEEYVACLIECAVVGSVEQEILERDKVKRCLQRSPKLKRLLTRAKRKIRGGACFAADMHRV